MWKEERERPSLGATYFTDVIIQLQPLLSDGIVNQYQRLTQNLVKHLKWVFFAKRDNDFNY